MNKKSGILIVLLAGILILWGLYSIGRLIIIKHKGVPIIATVLKADIHCDRYNEIHVTYAGKAYPVPIRNADCRNRGYQVGQVVKLIKYKDDDTLLWPEAKYEWVPLLFIAVLAFAYYTNKGKFRKLKKHTSDGAFVK
jgi:hypothetical protein